MATRRGSAKTVEPQPISSDELTTLKAAEFARLSRQTGWRLAWLVASSCEPGSAGRPPAKLGTSAQLTSGKLTFGQFAKLAGVGKTTVRYYWHAWNFAYEDSMVPCKAEDVPTDCEWQDGLMVPPDEFQLDDDDLGRPWAYYFDWAKTGQRPNPKRYEDNSEDEETDESEPEKQLNVVDDDDDSDSVDEDFGLPDAMSEDEVAEADSSIQREQLLEVLETVQALTGRVSNLNEILGDNDELLGQIASAALDLNSVANAMVAKGQPEAA